MAKKELKLHAVVSPTETVVVSAYDENGKAEACTLVNCEIFDKFLETFREY